MQFFFAIIELQCKLHKFSTDFASIGIPYEESEPWFEGDPRDLQQFANFLSGICGLELIW